MLDNITHRIDINVIKAASKRKKDGYLDEITNRGALINGFVSIADGDFRDINKRFALFDADVSSQNPTEKKETAHNLPTMADMAKSLTASTSKWASGGFRLASKEELNERLAICHSCEFWDSKRFGGTGRCMKCGCSTWAKIRLSTEKCPIGKW